MLAETMFTLGAGLYLVSLVPAAMNTESRFPVSTIALNLVLGLLYVAAYVSLGMYVPVGIAVLTTAAWGYLAAFRRIQDVEGVPA